MATQDEIIAIFAPHLMKQASRVRNGARLVHYTRAESAYKIIAGRQVWLRNSLLMNDFSEIAHGINCLVSAWGSPAGKLFEEWLERTRPGMHRQIADLFGGHTLGIRVATFMLSLSIHDDSEDDLGRLSMWRAYGGSSGVAMIFNPTIFTSSTNSLAVFSAPVTYRSVPEFVDWFQSWVDGLIQAESILADIPEKEFLNTLFLSCRTFALCTKHPGFREEQEWRIFHSPILDGTSSWLEKTVEIVAGIPQEIVKVKLFDDPDQGIVGIEPASLFNRIIIGPCNHPIPIRHALFNALQSTGVTDPDAMIRVSDIPLRQ